MISATSGPAYSVGVATMVEADGRVLDVWYPKPFLGDYASVLSRTGATWPGSREIDATAASELAGLELRTEIDPARGTRSAPVLTVIDDLASDPVDTYDAWLRLHLLSHRLVQPRSVSLEGLFGLLSNVVWTNHGPCAVDDFEATRSRLRGRRPVTVLSVDKFPRMVDYVVPTGVRIADADRVRLGAHLAVGTTVMHEGFVNFNAGTLGSSMVEGRISAGVVIGNGSDIGGGASIMGTLSGGGSEVISVGERCLIGANAGVGISLGDDCVVEAGLYVTAGTKIRLPDAATAKARDLSGHSGWLFRRNSQTGAVEAVRRSGDSWRGLNTSLHTND